MTGKVLAVTDAWGLDDDPQTALAADIEAVADLTPEQLYYLEHADEIEDETTGVECDAEDIYPGDEQYRGMTSEELLAFGEDPGA